MKYDNYQVNVNNNIDLVYRFNYYFNATVFIHRNLSRSLENPYA